MEILNNIHPLIKAMGEAIADPPSFFYIKCITDPVTGTEWAIYLNVDNKNKLTTVCPSAEIAENICEELNKYNLAKYGLIALYKFMKENENDLIYLMQTIENME